MFGPHFRNNSENSFWSSNACILPLESCLAFKGYLIINVDAKMHRLLYNFCTANNKKRLKYKLSSPKLPIHAVKKACSFVATFLWHRKNMSADLCLCKPCTILIIIHTPCLTNLHFMHK